MNIQNLIEKLSDREDLNETESTELIETIINSQLSDDDIGTVLIALNNKGVSATELYSFAKSLRQHAIHCQPKVESIFDTCGTGGDGSSTFNISTVTAFVIAACGVNIAKHGNRSISSKCGSADVLENLGININLIPKDVERCIEEIGIGFMFAPAHHPAFKNVGPIRKKLGVKTVFNMLGPLLNPANVDSQLIGVYDPGLTELFADVLKRLGEKSAMIVHGDGLDELTLCGKSKITQLKDGNIETFYIDPKDAGLEDCNMNDLKSETIEDSSKVFTDILEGNKSQKRDIVLLNAAAGLMVAGKVTTLKDGVEMAADAIDSGKALEKFEQLREFTNDLG